MPSRSKKALIIVDFEVNAETVFLVIKNGGEKPAFKLKIRPSHAIMGLEGRKDITKLAVFKKIRYLAPNKEIKIFVDSYQSFFSRLKKPKIRFRISYKSKRKKKIKSRIVHDLRIYADLIYIIKPFNT